MRMFRVVVNGSEYKVEIEEIREDGSAMPSTQTVPDAAPATSKQTTKAPVAAQSAPAAAAPKPKSSPASSGGAIGNIMAPMPGTILSVSINNGDIVTKGQTLLVLEAMKMENEIQAPADGVVQALNATQGASVNAGDILVVLSS